LQTRAFVSYRRRLSIRAATGADLALADYEVITHGCTEFVRGIPAALAGGNAIALAFAKAEAFGCSPSPSCLGQYSLITVGGDTVDQDFDCRPLTAGQKSSQETRYFTLAGDVLYDISPTRGCSDIYVLR
jgi:hypothetical protein